MAESADDRVHWLTSEGKRVSGSERELRAALASGSLSPKALVWRSGWAEWLPANRVAELADAIPAAGRESALKPRRDPNARTPPTAPVDRTPVGAASAPRAPRASAPPARNSQRAQPPPAPIRAKPSAPPPPAPSAAPSSPTNALVPPPNANPAPARAAAANAPPAAGLPPLAPLISGQRHEPKPLSPNPHEAGRDTLAPSSFGTIGAPRRAQPSATAARRDAVTPVARGRSPLPTLTEEGTVPSATATLRPPGAVPPPARGVPAVPALDSSGTFSFERRSAAITPIPAFAPPAAGAEAALAAGSARVGSDPAAALRASTPPSPAADAALTPSINEPARAANALPPVVNKALLQASAPAAPISQAAPASIEPALDSTLEVMPAVPPEARRTPVEPLIAARASLNSASEDVLARALSRHSLVKIGRFAADSRTVVMLLSALCGALLVALIAVYLTRSRGGEIAPATSASRVASAPPPPTPAPGCRVAVPAALIAPNVERSVPPSATEVGAEKMLALGFASTKTKGVGLRLNPDTLDASPAFEEDGKDAVRGVVPLTRSGSLAFFVDRDDSALHAAHTIDEVPPFTLGVSDAGFSRVVAGSSSLIWPLDPTAKITEPRTAAVGAAGYAVTFRRGGQTGEVLLGFVGADGAKKSELTAIPGAPKFLGTPVVAGSSAGALVAFAGRSAENAAWSVFVSLTKPGAPPSAARELVSGTGAGAISPALSPLAPDRWLVQWTEGVSGQYQVRVQSFSADLSPLGKPVLASPKGANAGQGALAVFAGGATTLFILTTAGHDELWGATLSCQ